VIDWQILVLKVETLERRRLVHDLVFIYKKLHGLCGVSLSITFANNSTRGNCFKLVKLAVIVMFGNIFSCSIVAVWNSLSETIVKSSSVNSFKNNLCNADLSKFLTVV